MTKKQEMAVARIRRAAENTLFWGNPEDYEFKEWEVIDHTEDYPCVEVRLTTGRKGDEGTMAAILCRESAQLFIGPRGGITYYKTIRDKEGNYKGISKRDLGSNSILQAVIDQR